LGGTGGHCELETLSLAEIQAALPQTGPETAIVRSGFPELYANPDITHVAFYNSYLATYLERDVRSLANVGKRHFERLLRTCALRSANLLHKADPARVVGIAPSTANYWLSTLEASGHVVLLQTWFSKSIVKGPKLYLSDTGLLENFIQTFLERDIREFGVNAPPVLLPPLYDVGALSWPALECIRARQIPGESHTTVKSHLDILTGALMVRQLQPWHENLGKRREKSPKIYVRDNGLLHALLGVLSLQIPGRTSRVGSWEGFEIEEILQLVGESSAYFGARQAQSWTSCFWWADRVTESR